MALVRSPFVIAKVAFSPFTARPTYLLEQPRSYRSNLVEIEASLIFVCDAVPADNVGVSLYLLLLRSHQLIGLKLGCGNLGRSDPARRQVLQE